MATPETSDTTTSTQEVGQEASLCPQIGFHIGFYRVFNQLQPSCPARLAQQNPGHALAACFVEEGRESSGGAAQIAALARRSGANNRRKEAT